MPTTDLIDENCSFWRWRV